MQMRVPDSERAIEVERLYAIAPVGLCYFDTQLRFRYINEWLARMNGLPVEAHLGKTIEDVLGDIAAGIVAQLRHVLESGEPIVGGEGRLETPAHPGELRNYMHNYYPDTGKDGTVVGVSCVVQDITELRQTETALRESESKLKLAARTAKLGHWSMHYTTGRYTSVSEEFARIFGYTAEEFLQRYPTMAEDSLLVHPDDRARVLAAYEVVNATPIEYRILHTDGKYRYVHEVLLLEVNSKSGDIWSEGTLQDITELRQTETALRESETMFSEAARAAKLGHWSMDYSSGKYLSVSEEYARIFGYTTDEFLRRYPTLEEDWRLVHPDDRAMVVAAYDGIAENLSVEYRIVRVDGEIRTVHETVWRETSSVSGVTRSDGTLQDITELRQVESDLRSAKEAADAANRAKSEFLAKMSHELRTPLHTVLGYSELMLDETKEIQSEHPELKSSLEKINQAGKHLAALISDVLDMSKIEAGMTELHITTFAVKDVVEDVIATIEPVVSQSGNALHVKGTGKSGDMTSDMNKTRQVLLNLMGNASKFTNNGRIELSVQRETCDGSESITFQVRDTGIGMSAEQIEDVFELFVQGKIHTNHVQAGTGLGLTISRELCHLMGGDITVESELGQGTVFTVRLPAVISKRQE